MMSARQFANKYPGKTVKLAAKHAKGLGLKEDQPIGIVVGFKIGKLGQPGSSKVAVWRDKFDFTYALGPKTDTKFNAVVPNPPNKADGIYFLSVDYLEVVGPVKPLKPVVTYPDRCKVCGSPCRNGNGYIACSNDRCKTKRTAYKVLGPMPKFYTTDKDGYILCPTCQTIDMNFQSDYGNNPKALSCRNKGHNFTHLWRDGQKMLHKGTHRYIWRNGRLEHWNEPKKAK